MLRDYENAAKYVRIISPPPTKILSSEKLYIGWSDVTVTCGRITISMLWGNTAYFVKLSDEDLSRYFNKIEIGWFKKIFVSSLSY